MTEKGKPFYQKILPRFIREPIRHRRAKETILSYYAGLPDKMINEEERVVLNYLKDHKLIAIPYSFQNTYKRKNISVYNDDTLNLKYIMFDGKRLYFKRKSSSRGIRRNYNYLLIEQDPHSPHRYLTENFNIEPNDILVDVGAAEGNLALSVIEKVKKVYLFETDERWIEALQATFSPWKDKVEIVNKFVSHKNDDRNTSLDQFFKTRENYSFLKIDAEGSEDKVLEGCETGLRSAPSLKLAITCYHRPNDEHLFKKYFEKRDFSTSCAQGYMTFDDPRTFFPPYLRRGVMRCEKNEG